MEVEKFLSILGGDFYTGVPDSLLKIGDSAFTGCISLLEIKIPISVKEIGADAFLRCENLVLNVARDSYAAKYAEDNGIPYVYPDANDWLKN